MPSRESSILIPKRRLPPAQPTDSDEADDDLQIKVGGVWVPFSQSPSASDPPKQSQSRSANEGDGGMEGRRGDLNPQGYGNDETKKQTGSTTRKRQRMSSTLHVSRSMAIGSSKDLIVETPALPTLSSSSNSTPEPLLSLHRKGGYHDVEKFLSSAKRHQALHFYVSSLRIEDEVAAKAIDFKLELDLRSSDTTIPTYQFPHISSTTTLFRQDDESPGYTDFLSKGPLTTTISFDPSRYRQSDDLALCVGMVVTEPRGQVKATMSEDKDARVFIVSPKQKGEMKVAGEQRLSFQFGEDGDTSATLEVKWKREPGELVVEEGETCDSVVEKELVSLLDGMDLTRRLGDPFPPAAILNPRPKRQIIIPQLDPTRSVYHLVTRVPYTAGEVYDDSDDETPRSTRFLVWKQELALYAEDPPLDPKHRLVVQLHLRICALNPYPSRVFDRERQGWLGYISIIHKKGLWSAVVYHLRQLEKRPLLSPSQLMLVMTDLEKELRLRTLEDAKPVPVLPSEGSYTSRTRVK